MFKISIKIVCFLIILSVFLLISSNVLLADDARQQFESGLDKAGTGAGYVFEVEGMHANRTKFSSIPGLVGLIIQGALSLLGVIFTVLIIYGGYLWMTGRGNEERVTKAKNTLQAAAIGLIIVLAAYAITFFVGSQLNKPAPPVEQENGAGG